MAEKTDSTTLYELLKKIVSELGYGYLKSITIISDDCRETVITR